MRDKPIIPKPGDDPDGRIRELVDAIGDVIGIEPLDIGASALLTILINVHERLKPSAQADLRSMLLGALVVMGMSEEEVDALVAKEKGRQA
jgi:hypothetical protein